MTDQNSYQSWLRRHVATLEEQQARRIALVAERRKMEDAIIEEKQRQITNLRAQLTLTVGIPK